MAGMGPFLGTLSWIAGATLLTLTVKQLRHANPHSRLPQFFGRPAHHPGDVYIYRAIALFLLTMAALAWKATLGYWAFALILLGGVPGSLLAARHNRRMQDLAYQS